MITLYTDGACSGNGKENSKGGFGVVVVLDDKIIDSYQKFSENTTNNREEIKAILWALENYGCDKNEFQYPVVYSDSMYCVNTFNEWMYNWAKNGWIKSDKKVPENLDLIQKYFNSDKRIELKYIKGHNGNKYNEIADGLATGKYQTKDFKLFDIKTLKVEKDDNILITIDPNIIDIEDTPYIYNYFSEAYPNNKIIVVLKGIEIETNKN